MSRIKKKINGQWVYADMALSNGGGANVIISNTPPSDHTAIWIDTNTQTNASIPITSVVGLQAILNRIMYPQILVSAPIGSSINVTNGVEEYEVEETEEEVTTFTIHSYGEWTVTMVSGGTTRTRIVSVDAVKQYYAMWVRLPSAYQEVEYIESTGTQRIDTGVIPTIASRFATEFSINNMSYFSSWSCEGITGATGCAVFEWGYGGEYNKFMVRCGTDESSASWSSTNVPNDTEKHIVDIQSGSQKFDDNEFEVNVINSNSNHSLILFARWCGEYDAYTKQRKYWAKIYESNILIRHFIPCYRVSDNAIGMYDMVTNTFYTNSGSGTFLKGGNV